MQPEPRPPGDPRVGAARPTRPTSVPCPALMRSALAARSPCHRFVLPTDSLLSCRYQRFPAYLTPYTVFSRFTRTPYRTQVAVRPGPRPPGDPRAGGAGAAAHEAQHQVRAQPAAKVRGGAPLCLGSGDGRTSRRECSRSTGLDACLAHCTRHPGTLAVCSAEGQVTSKA